MSGSSWISRLIKKPLKLYSNYNKKKIIIVILRAGILVSAKEREDYLDKKYTISIPVK